MHSVCRTAKLIITIRVLNDSNESHKAAPRRTAERRSSSIDAVTQPAQPIPHSILSTLFLLPLRLRRPSRSCSIVRFGSLLSQWSA